jgi:hypothetical protein
MTGGQGLEGNFGQGVATGRVAHDMYMKLKPSVQGADTPCILSKAQAWHLSRDLHLILHYVCLE